MEMISRLSVNQVLEYIKVVRDDFKKYNDGEIHYIDDIVTHRLGDFVKLRYKNSKKAFAFVSIRAVKQIIVNMGTMESIIFVNGDCYIKGWAERVEFDLSEDAYFNISISNEPLPFTLEEMILLSEYSKTLYAELYFNFNNK